MNWQHFLQHFSAIVWLRWRIGMNQLQRGGVFNAILLALAAVAVVLFAFGCFFGFFLVGWLALAQAPNWVVLLVWDGVAGAFLFVWLIGLLNEMQRAESLSLDKFLHLPVSPTGAFLINYLSSLVNVTLILFLSAATGLAIGQIVARGAWGLLAFPLVAAFVLAVTALTYQFQGWLASLMANPRRRRTIVVAVSSVVILISQLPNVIFQGGRWTSNDHDAEFRKASAELSRSLQAGEITQEEYAQRSAELRREHPPVDRKAQVRMLEQSAWIVNLVLPPGWLPLGAAGTFEDNPWPAILGTLGLGLIGAGSLYRAYRTTLRLYRGEFSSGKATTAPEPISVAAPAAVGNQTRFLERQLPWLADRTAAVSLASIVALWRAPEVKLMLISPLIMGFVFAWIFLSSGEPPVMVRPLIALGGMVLILLSLVQLAGNAFGFDRSGFRVYVLSPAPRRDVLLGKNLALAPMPVLWGTILLAFLQWRYPLRLDHLAAAVPMFVSTFAIFCAMANWVSIFAPMQIASGTMRRSNPKMIVFLLHLVFFFTFPIALTVVMLPLGVEYAAEALGLAEGVPILLTGSLVVCAGAVALYWFMLGWQGNVLQRREQAILNVVTARE